MSWCTAVEAHHVPSKDVLCESVLWQPANSGQCAQGPCHTEYILTLADTLIQRRVQSSDEGQA